MPIKVISAAAVVADKTDAGKKAVTTLTSKTADRGTLEITPADIKAGLVVCNEASETVAVLKGTATEIIASLGGSPGDVFKLWLVNGSGGVISLNVSSSTGTVISGDKSTTRTMELQFIVLTETSIMIAARAYGAVK